MAKLRPIKRKDLISSLRQLDFTGPYVGGKHQYMQRGRLKVRIPNPHQSDISVALLKRILEEADVSLQEWEQLWGEPNSSYTSSLVFPKEEIINALFHLSSLLEDIA